VLKLQRLQETKTHERQEKSAGIGPRGAVARRGWYYGWNIVAVCVVSQLAANGLATSSFSLFLHDWSVQFHCTISTLQLGFVAYGSTNALISPLIGVLVDRYHIRLVFGIGLASISIMCLAVSFSTAAWQILVLYTVLLSIAIGCSDLLPANAVVSRWFVKRLGLALGLTAFGQGFAGLVVPPLVAAAMPSLGWRTIWRIAGITIGAVVVPIVLGVLRDRPTEREGLHYLSDNDVARTHECLDGESGLTWHEILKRRNFWLLVAVYLPLVASISGCMTNFAPIAASRGFSLQISGTLLSVLSLSWIIATPLAGLVSDYFGNRLPLASLAFASAIGSLFLAFGQSVPIVGFGVVFMGLSGGFWPILAAAIAAEFGPRNFGRAFGLLTVFLPIAILAPFMVAKVQEVSGSYDPALFALAALTALGGGACLLMRIPRNLQIALVASSPLPR
jgi:OFA family oxalate/formate antiporter-like MFS transporter